jgi:hypothetical protein
VYEIFLRLLNIIDSTVRSNYRIEQSPSFMCNPPQNSFKSDLRFNFSLNFILPEKNPLPKRKFEIYSIGKVAFASRKM